MMGAPQVEGESFGMAVGSACCQLLVEIEVDENKLLDGVSKRKLVQESSFCSWVAGE